MGSVKKLLAHISLEQSAERKRPRLEVEPHYNIGQLPVTNFLQQTDLLKVSELPNTASPGTTCSKTR